MPKFDLEDFCKFIQELKITFAYVVPPIVLLLSKHPLVSNYDLSSIRMMNSGAAPLTRELVDAVHDRLKIPVKQGYGLSETSPTTHTQPYILSKFPRYCLMIFLRPYINLGFMSVLKRLPKSLMESGLYFHTHIGDFKNVYNKLPHWS